jgi:tRNA uridine 5-carbamoylmethylation protein Kti12
MKLTTMTSEELETYADSLFKQVCQDFGNPEPAEKLDSVLNFIEQREKTQQKQALR